MGNTLYTDNSQTFRRKQLVLILSVDDPAIGYLASQGKLPPKLRGVRGEISGAELATSVVKHASFIGKFYTNSRFGISFSKKRKRFPMGELVDAVEKDENGDFVSRKGVLSFVRGDIVLGFNIPEYTSEELTGYESINSICDKFGLKYSSLVSRYIESNSDVLDLIFVKSHLRVFIDKSLEKCLKNFEKGGRLTLTRKPFFVKHAHKKRRKTVNNKKTDRWG